MATPPAYPPSRPPSYSSSVSMSRSRTMPDDVRSVAEAMLQFSLSPKTASSSSTATTMTPGAATPSSHTAKRSTAPSTTSSHTAKRSTAPSLSTAKGDTADAADRARLAAAVRLPSSGSSATAVTTTRTRERLRMAELERDKLRHAVDGERAKASEMRRLAEKERAIAERLKLEGDGPGLSAAEVKHRVRELSREARVAGAHSPRPSTAGLFKAVCSTDLLFLIDTTGSMQGHINAAKEQVQSIVKDITAAFFNEAEVRIAVVGYKDHSDMTNIQFLDFTPSADRVYLFLNTLTASGGGDAPEDVLGGIQQAINATWMQQTRCMIHITDAPPHGRTLHDLGDSGDNYPNPGGEPHGLTHEPLLKQMLGLNINYALLRINNTTDRMAFAFFQAYAAASADCKLLTSNKYYSDACGMNADFYGGFRDRTNSKRSAKAGLLFEEMELGTTYSALRHLVLKSVTTSATRTAVRITASATRMKRAAKTVGMGLAAIEEDGDDADDTKLETTAPQWNTPGWLDETLMVEGFSLDVVVHGASTLNNMMAHDDNIKMSITELTIHKRSQPFAQGAMRIASYARMAVSTNRFVVKSFKRGGKHLAHLAEDMRCQALCKAFALEFNALSMEKYSIDFIVTTCLKGKSGTASVDDCMFLEPFIEGAYVKYNNNCGYVNSDTSYFNQAAQAFSHFTFERSQGRFLVSDLQGVGHSLTDPAIHTLDPERFKLTDTNLGQDGFKFFFSTHVCNSICHNLGLKSNASMIISGKNDFRETWPIMDNTACCSNKLCGRIVRVTKAMRSDKFPGYQWCNVCWPQLQSSIVKWICVSPGPHHEFDVSKFFYESQGQIPPRRCSKHYKRDETVSRTAVVGGSLWARLRSATRKKSMSGKIE